MKKVWLLLILFLTTVSNANNNPVLEQTISIPVEEVIVEPVKVYYPLYDSGFVVDSSTVVLLGNIRITEKMFNILDSMFNAALKDSVRITIASGYRTFEEQFACRINNARKKYKRDTAFLLSAESSKFHPVTAKPGYSSHQRGIAFDFNTSDKEVYGWLKQNGIKFGFVRTVKSEKWHWEYRPEVTDMYAFIKPTHRSWK